MAISHQMEARRVILTRLKSFSELTDITDQIYGQRVPQGVEWPFVSLGPSNTVPLRGGVTRGGTVSIPVHAWAKDSFENGVEVEYAEDFAGRIGKAIEGALEQYGEPRTGGGRFSILVSDRNLMQDNDASIFHYFSVANVRVIA